MADDSLPPGTPPAGDLPAAASTVSGGDLNEGDAGELVRLQKELEDERAKTKPLQVRIAELEDQVNTLKAVPAPKKGRDWFNEL